MTPLRYAERDCQAVAEQQQTGLCVPFEKEYFRKDGSLVPVFIGYAVFDLTEQKTIGFVLDLSDRKQAEAFSILEERSRIARDIHDTLAQAFTSIGIHLEVAARNVDSDLAMARACMQTSTEVAQTGLAEARRSLTALRPYGLEHGSLYDALRQAARQIFAHSPTQVTCHYSGLSYRLPPETETALLRIGQEALMNACKHAKATVVHLNLTYQASQCSLAIQDNGIGFAIDNSQTSLAGQQLGLVGMAERSQQVGAELLVQSIPTQGTAIMVTVRSGYANEPS